MKDVRRTFVIEALEDIINELKSEQVWVEDYCTHSSIKVTEDYDLVSGKSTIIKNKTRVTLDLIT